MPGKVILVKTSSCFLIVATALSFDGESETVILDRPVELDANSEPTIEVPKQLCYEFDPDMFQHVNALVTAAHDKLNAAQQLCDTGLLAVEFETSGDPGTLRKH